MANPLAELRRRTSQRERLQLALAVLEEGLVFFENIAKRAPLSDTEEQQRAELEYQHGRVTASIAETEQRLQTLKGADRG